jgi:hypothetical protein
MISQDEEDEQEQLDQQHQHQQQQDERNEIFKQTYARLVQQNTLHSPSSSVERVAQFRRLKKSFTPQKIQERFLGRKR